MSLSFCTLFIISHNGGAQELMKFRRANIYIYIGHIYISAISCVLQQCLPRVCVYCIAVVETGQAHNRPAWARLFSSLEPGDEDKTAFELRPFICGRKHLDTTMLPMAVQPATTPALAARPRFPAPRPSTSLAAASSSCIRPLSFKSRRSLRILAAAAAEADAVEAEESLGGYGEELPEEEVMTFQGQLRAYLLIHCLL
jgi:hypothetical protein